eukprot:383702-Prymnesium_polylepis.2
MAHRQVHVVGEHGLEDVASHDADDARRPERRARRHVVEDAVVRVRLEDEAHGLCEQVDAAGEDGVRDLRDRRVVEPRLVEHHVLRAGDSTRWGKSRSGPAQAPTRLSPPLAPPPCPPHAPEGGAAGRTSGMTVSSSTCMT